MKLNKILIYSICLTSFLVGDDAGNFSITRIQYRGGGDWYCDQSSIPNLLNFISNNTNIPIDLIEKKSKIGDDIFIENQYLYLTGHGNIKFSDEESIILRNHLLAGAFLHADDNYGMDKSFRREMKKVFPEKDWVELPFSHPLFHSYYDFPNGLPKIHKHNDQPPQALALFDDNRLIVLYTFECDLGDGWENQSVHNNSDIIRTKALQMGTNIVMYNLIGNE
tara:strand:+ start:2661 stop:3326 length:666 start_codon:yes stop_codon:yes gene_type:complete